MVDLAVLFDAAAIAVMTKEGNYFIVPLAQDITSNCD
jgi:hypothetical protein